MIACSDDFITAAAFLPGTRLVGAAASSSKERAQDFAQRHGFQKSYGSYQELAADKEIDIVYVGNVHPQHRVGTAMPGTVPRCFCLVTCLAFPRYCAPLYVGNVHRRHRVGSPCDLAMDRRQCIGDAALVQLPQGFGGPGSLPTCSMIYASMNRKDQP